MFKQADSRITRRAPRAVRTIGGTTRHIRGDALRLFGVPIGPRKKLAAVVAMVALGLFALVTQAFGVGWGLVLLAAGVGAAIFGIGVVAMETRRQRRQLDRLTDRLDQTMETLEGVTDASPDHSADFEKVNRILVGLDRSLSELRAVAADLDDGARHTAYQVRRDRAGQAWTEAELRRQAADQAPVRAHWDTEFELIRSSELFDADWYRRQVTGSVTDPVGHYMAEGVQAGLDPHPLFANTWYLRRHPEALRRWRTPLAHFLAEGGASGNDPHPAFSSSWYLEQNTGFHDATLPVLHYLTEATSDPNPLFDSDWYFETHGIPADANPLVHYLTVGHRTGLDPHPRFKTADVARRLGVVGTDPLGAFLDLQADPSISLAEIAPPRNTPNEGDMKWEYLVKGLHQVGNSFVLYRIIGNDLPPRHRKGQGLDNLRFVLEHEPDLAGCEKRWVVNRITDPDYEKEIIALLEEHDRPYLHIPFHLDEYRKVGWRFHDFPVAGFTYQPAYRNLEENHQIRALDHVYHDKNLYVMNNNGARNAALHEGREVAKWVLPWDGNCYLTAAAWDRIVAAVTETPHFKYFTVPMARVPYNEQLLEPDLEPPATEEPQLLFRSDAKEEFDEDFRYGHRPKVELFYRLGIPGPWDRWPRYPWDRATDDLSPEAGQVGTAGWVARLSSGRSDLEADFTGRGRHRIEAIMTTIDRLDQEIALERYDPAALVFIDEEVLGQQRDAWRSGNPDLVRIVAELEERVKPTLDGPLYSVIDKTTLPPSGARHDYWHPSPYWWPNPDTPDGLPYVPRDGERVPGTQFGEPGTEQYDRSSLQSMIDETTLATLLGYFSGDGRLFKRGADLVRTWFVNPETRMNPHLKYSQVRMGHDNNLGTQSGIIETSDFYYLLDAVRLLELNGALSGSDSEALREWFSEFRAWLHESRQGRRERGALNNHGTWYDVQTGAIEAYLDDLPNLLATVRRSHERVGQQFAPDGSQPEELARTLTQHYCCYNLQGWLMLGQLSSRVGQNLITYRDPRGLSVGPAIQWVLDRANAPWAHPQIEPFNEDRFAALAHHASPWLPDLTYEGLETTHPSEVTQVFSPHDGTRPFWFLGNADLHPAGLDETGN